MSSLAPTPLVPDGDAREAAVEELARAFKATMGALRRLKGRESHGACGLSHAQYGVLFCLRDADSRPTGEIALAADLSPAATTEMLEGLANAGLVERSRSERDRRVVLTSLTERGRALVEERRTDFESRLHEALAEFSAQELNDAAAVLGRLGEMFEALGREREPG
ncbi:MAG TPA: MarR family transcriptional regulator [Solirubrobacteraceae bacterium]|nr:MarR family transcriptional regulator [Solirubrobacteraceae bacterium]